MTGCLSLKRSINWPMKSLLHPVPGSRQKKTWRNFITALLLLCFITATFIFCRTPSSLDESDSSKAQRLFAVSGNVTQTFSYCGGAAPSKEILDQLATPVPFAGKKFYIRKGEVNDTNKVILKSFESDSKGNFSFSLPNGTYSIIVEEQLHAINPSDYSKEFEVADEKCLLDWWSKPYFILRIKDSDIKQLNFSFFHRCFVSHDIPCITYQGPPPP